MTQPLSFQQILQAMQGEGTSFVLRSASGQEIEVPATLKAVTDTVSELNIGGTQLILSEKNGNVTVTTPVYGYGH